MQSRNQKSKKVKEVAEDYISGSTFLNSALPAVASVATSATQSAWNLMKQHKMVTTVAAGAAGLLAWSFFNKNDDDEKRLNQLKKEYAIELARSDKLRLEAEEIAQALAQANQDAQLLSTQVASQLKAVKKNDVACSQSSSSVFVNTSEIDAVNSIQEDPNNAIDEQTAQLFEGMAILVSTCETIDHIQDKLKQHTESGEAYGYKKN